jgi:hypothetical protein
MSAEPSISLVLLGSCYNYFCASGATIFEAQIAQQRVPVYLSVRQARVTDCVLTLIAEQTKATL